MKKPMTTSPLEKELVAKLTTALNDSAKAITRTPKTKPHPHEIAREVFESIPVEMQARVLDKAVGKGVRRFNAAAYVLTMCNPSETVDNFIRKGLAHPEEDFRSTMIQLVGLRALNRFADDIARIIVESDGNSRAWAVSAAGNVREPVCLAALLKYAETFGDEQLPFGLLWSLSKHHSPSVKPQLERAFKTHPEDRHRVCAARGLGHQDDDDAIQYLVSKLDEPDIESESRRAAQALSDLFGWGIEWTPKAQQQAKERWAAMTKSR